MQSHSFRELEGAFNEAIGPFLEVVMRAGSIQCVTPSWRQQSIITSPEYRKLKQHLFKEQPYFPKLYIFGWLEMLHVACVNPGSVQALVSSLRGAGHLSAIFGKTPVGGMFDSRARERRKAEWGLLVQYSYAMLFQTANPMMRLEKSVLTEELSNLLTRRVRRARKWLRDYETRFNRPFIATRAEKSRAHKFLPKLYTSGGGIELEVIA